MVGPDGKVLTLLAADFAQPNGLCFSLDEKILFVNDTDRHTSAPLTSRRMALANSRVWAETRGDGPGAPDVVKLDSAGNLFCCGPGGIHVFAPDATSLGVIKVPEYTANFCWGDDDLKSLFITASTSVYRIRLTTPGLAQLR